MQTRLGHSKVSTTIDRYKHVMPRLDEDLADLLDATFADSPGITGISSLGATADIAPKSCVAIYIAW